MKKLNLSRYLFRAEIHTFIHGHVEHELAGGQGDGDVFRPAEAPSEYRASIWERERGPSDTPKVTPLLLHVTHGDTEFPTAPVALGPAGTAATLDDAHPAADGTKSRQQSRDYFFLAVFISSVIPGVEQGWSQGGERGRVWSGPSWHWDPIPGPQHPQPLSIPGCCHPLSHSLDIRKGEQGMWVITELPNWEPNEGAPSAVSGIPTHPSSRSTHWRH